MAGEPVTRFRWSTVDPDAATEYLRATYTDFTPVPIPPQGFAFWTQLVTAGPLSVGRLRHTGPVHTRARPAASPTVVETLAGGPHYIDDGHGRVHGTLKLTPTWTAFDTGWEDVTVQTVALDAEEVARVAAGLSGLEPEAVTFSSVAPISPALADYWCRHSRHLHDEILTSDTLMAEPLVRANTVHGIASALLATFPNTALHALGDPRRRAGRAEPATVRRAVEFIDGHAHEDIDLSEIAAAARTGARSLQLAFRRHRDTTPLEYLRRVRLDGAHRDLLAGDPAQGDRVETIAARWGFGHPGRFSVTYRQHYALSPSETLRR